MKASICFLVALLLLVALLVIRCRPDAAESILVGRSPQWRSVRDSYLSEHPQCAACGTMIELNVHHIRPVHLFPELELVRDNLITLCRDHHFSIGHDPDGPGPERPGWKKWNPNVREHARLWQK